MTKVKRVLMAACLVIALTAVVAGSAGADRSQRRDFEVAALAIPSATDPHDQAEEIRIDRARAHDVRISGVATTSLTCDACTGHAVAVQVIYSGKATSFVARNVAAVWASRCTGCHGWALSIQIVIARDTTAVSAANRALALNAGCVDCNTAAAAIQVVVVGASGKQLSATAVDRIDALRDDLIARLRSIAATSLGKALPVRRNSVAPAGTPRTAPTADGVVTATTAQIQDVLATDLSATSTSHDIKVTRGD
jgi:hypothetical protein